MLNLPGGKFIVITLMVLVLGVAVATIQIAGLAGDVERLDEQVKKLSKSGSAGPQPTRAQREEQERLQMEADAEKDELKSLVARLSDQVEMMEGRMGTLDSSVAGVKTSLDKAMQAATGQPQDTEALAKMLAPSEKESLRQVIREELEDGSKKQTNILMDIFGNRIMDRFAKELNLTDQQRTQIDGILRDSMQNTMKMWNEGTAKNAQEAQAGMGIIMTETNTKIRSVLTTEQSAKFDTMVQQGMRGMRRAQQEAADPPKPEQPPGETY